MERKVPFLAMLGQHQLFTRQLAFIHRCKDKTVCSLAVIKLSSAYDDVLKSLELS